ncbi:glycoside hydrolase family 38 C-terminal domain-containing protein [Actinospica sp.]|uniref:glycoside hydrolase family 38 N-terminal domain-containing protein n=1 Tax=Actinospica sp. TaxID=1872142 RepID=UPI002CAB91C6|nr:glycoside hydrolase family 38 C-terminal domain-containing protein [Actinospica sp.]HWG24854.1 glycoside hydrolase family 38 C-terminal domain-containing protein [Actinospica sp.]
MRITAVHDTDLFIGTLNAPRQLTRVVLAGLSAPATVRIDGPLVETPVPAVVASAVHSDAGEVGVEVTVEVGVVFRSPSVEGGTYQATVIVESGDARVTQPARLTRAESGWTMWMISHFHYDPVWWNTQAGFTETWLDLPGAQEKRMPFQLSAFDLVRAHLDAALDDEDYAFVLAEVDYLKPYWDRFPRDRNVLRRLMREGRVELVGGSYNEANTNLTHPESTVRNLVYGMGYQRDVLGGEPRSAWMVDVFGHDPAYPGLVADAGMDSSVWARGPWHHVGAKRHTGDISRQQFPSEFEWISPSGRGVLTGYLADHYVAGWDIERVDTLEESMQKAHDKFSELKKVAATRNVLLPVGHDHNVPSRFCTQIHREWNARYVWPRFQVGIPRDFFAAVRADAEKRRTVISMQTRDMNPVYTGKDVSYIDTKQAQRAAEVAVLDGERLASLALLLGARYPHEALDKAWRQLVYGAHHDAITGTESDQVYLDLLNGWREADELGREVIDGSIDFLARHVARADGHSILAVNTLSFERDAITTATVKFAERLTEKFTDESAEPVRGVRVVDPAGVEVPALTESVVRRADGSIAEIALSFLAKAVPSLGYRVYGVVPADDVPAGWVRIDASAPSARIENESFVVEADPARGGALSSVVDLRAGRELVRPDGLAGELTLQAELADHDYWGEGPWHLLPTGPGTATGERPAASVHVETGPLGSRIVATTELEDLRITQLTNLWRGIERVDLTTHVDGSIGQDHLLRARFQFDAPGLLPVAEVGFGAVGRSFGFPEADAAQSLWTLDSPAHTWAGLSATVRLNLRREGANRDERASGDDNSVDVHAIGVAEVVDDTSPDRAEHVRALIAALAAKGVTSTLTKPDGERYGALDVDSNLPDVRIVLGRNNVFASAVLDAAGPEYRAALEANGRVFVPALRTRREQWVPGADLRGPRDLPVLIIGSSPAAIAELIDDLSDAAIEVPVPAGLATTAEPADDYSIAVVNRGTSGFVVDAESALSVNLMRACSGFPSRYWIEGERRTVPDGSSFAWQHWSHSFALSIVAGPGDWRESAFSRVGQDVNHPVRAKQAKSALRTESALSTELDSPADRPLPAELSLISVTPHNVLLTTAKAAGNPLASGVCEGHPSELSLRIYDSAGLATSAIVRVHGGIESARRTDLLEDNSSEVLTPIDASSVTVDLSPADVATIRIAPTPPSFPDHDGALAHDPLARIAEPVQPVFTRYWLHDAGPAPIGNLPSSVHISAAESALTVTVSCSGHEAGGVAELVVPEGVSAADVDLPYKLAPGEHAEFGVPFTTSGEPGRYIIAARIRDDLGQVLEDTVEIRVGDVAEGEAADGDLVDVVTDWSPVRLAPGRSAELPVRLTNLAASEIRGEVALISPYGTWIGDGDVTVTPRVQPFTLRFGESATLSFTAHADPAARAGAHWWALARVACHGRLRYQPSTGIAIVESAA